MIDPDSPRPSSDQPSASHRERPDCPAIVPPSMSVAPQSGQEIDDEQWSRIVVESLSTRSREAKEALLKALQNDQPARSTGSSSSIIEDLEIGEPGVSRDAVQHDQTQASSDVSNNITSTPNHGDGSDNTEISLEITSPQTDRVQRQDAFPSPAPVFQDALVMLRGSVSRRGTLESLL